ncbi:uncharacterized protein LOC131149245 [Malania oleifera]|uniref:uncharacterized protein LOC131149245 n=1 Tax=Malania oleifera TaxID=397392 RepID=UPI0025ADCF2A|nr:uncharacterized protein LOC131149245 [Malania oleifera]
MVRDGHYTNVTARNVRYDTLRSSHLKPPKNRKVDLKPSICRASQVFFAVRSHCRLADWQFVLKVFDFSLEGRLHSQGSSSKNQLRNLRFLQILEACKLQLSHSFSRDSAVGMSLQFFYFFYFIG